MKHKKANLIGSPFAFQFFCSRSAAPDLLALLLSSTTPFSGFIFSFNQKFQGKKSRTLPQESRSARMGFIPRLFLQSMIIYR